MSFVETVHVKVARLKAPAVRVLEEGSPVPGAGEVLVRVRASSLNPRDDFVIKGIIPAAEGQPVIDRSFGLDEISAAFEHYRAKSHFGKAVLEI